MSIEPIAAGALRREGSSWFRYDLVGHAAMLADVVAVVGGSLLSGLAYFLIKGDGGVGPLDTFAVGALFAVLFVMLAQMRGLYRPIELLRPLRQLSNVIALWVVVAAFLTSVGFALKAGHMISRGATVSFIVTSLVLVGALRVFWHSFMRLALDKGKFASRRIAIIGDEKSLDQVRLVQKLAPFGLSVVARFNLPSGADAGAVAFSGALDEIVARLRGSQIEEIIIAVDRERLMVAHGIVDQLRILPLPIKLLLDIKLGDLLARPVQRWGTDIVALDVHRAPMSVAERLAKRSLDIGIAGTTLLLISPMLALTALAIRIDSPGPVLFRQTRNGFNNRPFKILKFRSMRVMEDGQAVRQASRHDDRVTKVGRWIRKLSIDELPQLWNVLRGEMSIVGPRPHALAHDEHYEKLIGDYPYRQHVKPGLTGWAQVNGSRGETPTIESMAERVRLDLWYVENASVWLDIRIIARTFATLLNVKHTY